MTPRAAAGKLLESKKRRKQKTGPPSEKFTLLEYEAIRVLTAEKKSMGQIANMAGVSLTTFKRITEKDEKLRDALLLGRDDRVEKLWQAAAKHAFDKDSAKQLRALELLAKLEGMLNNKGKSGHQTNVLVNVNANTAPSAVDGRSHAALMKRLQKNKAPVTIEHKPAEPPRLSLDPIAALKERSKTDA